METILAIIVSVIATAILVIWLTGFRKPEKYDGENKLILDYIEALRKKENFGCMKTDPLKKLLFH